MKWLKRHHLNAADYLIVAVIGKAVSVLLIPLYTRRLTRSEYGTYGLALTLYSIVPPLVSLAMSSAMARFFFDYRDERERDRALGTIAAFIVFVSLLGASVSELALDVLPVGPVIAGLTHDELRAVVWTCALIPLTEIPVIYYRASERAAPYSAIYLSQVALVAGSTAYLMLARHLGLPGMLYGMLIGQAAIALYAIVFTFRVLEPTWDRKILRESILYSLPFIPHALGNSLMVGADRWALEMYGFRDGLGLYTLATQLTLPISLATQAWNEASSPRFLSAWRDGGEQAARRALPRITAGFVVCGVGTLLLILAARPLLALIVGPHFVAAFGLLPWVGGSLCIGVLFSAFINVLFLRKTTRIIPVLTLTSVLLNVLLNMLLVPRFGVTGAIVATGIAYAFRSGLMLAFALRALRADEAPPSGRSATA